MMTRAQKIYAAVLAVLGLIGLASQIAMAFLKYYQAPSQELLLIGRLGDIAFWAAFGCGLLMFVLQRIGVLPTVKNDAYGQASSQGPTRSFRFRNIAIWIVIALVLVFAFNLSRGDRKPSPVVDMVVNLFPMLLLIGVWFIISRMVRKRPSDNSQ